jgi:hypothetical protein
LSQNVILPAPSSCPCHLGGSSTSKGNVYITASKRGVLLIYNLQRSPFTRALNIKARKQSFPQQIQLPRTNVSISTSSCTPLSLPKPSTYILQPRN